MQNLPITTQSYYNRDFFANSFNKQFDEIDGRGFGRFARNFDEIDRSGFAGRFV